MAASSPYSILSSIIVASLFRVVLAAASDAGSASVNPPVDQSLLAIQIGGIIGGYVISVASLLFLLLVVGRPLRRRVVSSHYCTSEVEMVTPSKPSVDVNRRTSSLNKLSSLTRSWSSFTKGTKSHVSNVSNVTFDESIMAADRQKAQEQMESLYAAVMENDSKRAAGINDSTDDFHPPSSPTSNPFGTPISQREGPFFNQEKERDDNVNVDVDVNPPTGSRSKARLPKVAPLPLFNAKSGSSTDSDSEASQYQRGPSIRKLPISPPVVSPRYGEDQQPLSPRFYNPGPPPLTPPAVQTNQGKAGRARAPTPLKLSVSGDGSSSGGAGNSENKTGTSTLLFREAYPPQSAPATKTTIVERPGNLGAGPRTGAPTPYSPYMPFTPVTPITPSRMVTRKQRKREDKGAGLRVLHEDDMVKEDKDMWGY